MAELARGGMAIAWLAEARGPGGFVKHFVVKELLPNLAQDEEHRAMFLAEARLAAKLEHENIVRTLHVDEDGDRLFMVLELLHGCSVDRARALLAGTGMPVGAAVTIVRELLDALQYAHELRDESGPLRIVHRDVSARNVFLTTSGEVKLLDFGLAKSAGRERRSEPGIVKGSFGYMSPEHVGTVPLDRRSDVFAAGILLRELLLGKRLWDGVDDASIVRKLLARDIPVFPSDTTVPDSLVRICEKAMAPHRLGRYGSAAEMRDALDDWCRSSGEATRSADLAGLFDGPLAVERDRARLLARTTPPSPPPAELVLPSDLLESVTVERPRLFGVNGVRRGPLALGIALATLLALGTLLPRIVDASDDVRATVAGCEAE
ncbi:MAG TPA: serine/threonine-protein kinase [Labilithrix sp.]|nr:serine/threonine-protein kinase [Labilithrix sp.]